MNNSPCPICQKPVDGDNRPRSFPFCSPRCQTIDLGNWLGERYAVPVGPAPDAEDQAQQEQPDEPGEADGTKRDTYG
jgi:endogenous inhibitor of DNA gyrase (YacG/DUF329 family)